MKCIKYTKMHFGRKENRIDVTLLSHPIKMGLAGMVRGKQFNHTIALVVEPDDVIEKRAAGNLMEYYNLACLTFNSKPEFYAVRMESEVFYGIKRGEPMARTILLHELGHYYQRQMTGSAEVSEKHDAERSKLVEEGLVSQHETDADDFAAMYLGNDYVAKGLEAIKLELLRRIDEECYEDNDITFRELDSRIARLK